MTMKRGHTQVVPGETSKRDHESGHIQAHFWPLLPLDGTGLDLNVTNGGTDGR